MKALQRPRKYSGLGRVFAEAAKIFQRLRCCFRSWGVVLGVGAVFWRAVKEFARQIAAKKIGFRI